MPIQCHKPQCRQKDLVTFDEGHQLKDALNIDYAMDGWLTDSVIRLIGAGVVGRIQQSQYGNEAAAIHSVALIEDLLRDVPITKLATQFFAGAG